MSAEITYRGFDNEDQSARIRELMEEVRPLFPQETRNIIVNLYDQFAQNNNSVSLCASIGSTEYLYFELSVFHVFFDNPRAKQRAKIAHEIVHALMADLLMFDRDNLIDYVKSQNPDLGAFLGREHTRRVERVTQYLAFAIDEAMDQAERNGRDRVIRDRGAIFVAKEDTIKAPSLTETRMASGMGMEPFPGRSRDREDAVRFSGAIAIGKKEPERQTGGTHAE